MFHNLDKLCGLKSGVLTAVVLSFVCVSVCVSPGGLSAVCV
jgi:hypothetical protein